MKPCILFDWDGTLAHNFSVIKNALNRVFSHFGLPEWQDDDAEKNIRLTAKDLFATLFDDADDRQKALEIYLGYVEKNHLIDFVSIDGAAVFLKNLQATDRFVMGVVSNKTQRFLDAEIGYLGWQDYFMVQIGAGTAAKDKPHPDSINMALSQIGGQAKNSFYIGDTHTDMIAAKNAGIEPLFVTYGLGRVKDLSSQVFTHGLPKCFDNYDDLFDYLTK